MVEPRSGTFGCSTEWENCLPSGFLSPSFRRAADKTSPLSDRRPIVAESPPISQSGVFAQVGATAPWEGPFHCRVGDESMPGVQAGSLPERCEEAGSKGGTARPPPGKPTIGGRGVALDLQGQPPDGKTLGAWFCGANSFPGIGPPGCYRVFPASGKKRDWPNLSLPNSPIIFWVSGATMNSANALAPSPFTLGNFSGLTCIT